MKSRSMVIGILIAFGLLMGSSLASMVLPKADEIKTVSPLALGLLTSERITLDMDPGVIRRFLRDGKVTPGVANSPVWSLARLTLKSGRLIGTWPAVTKLIAQHPDTYDLRGYVMGWGVVVTKEDRILFFKLINDRALAIYAREPKFDEDPTDAGVTLILPR